MKNHGIGLLVYGAMSGTLMLFSTAMWNWLTMELTLQETLQIAMESGVSMAPWIVVNYGAGVALVRLCASADTGFGSAMAAGFGLWLVLAPVNSEMASQLADTASLLFYTAPGSLLGTLAGAMVALAAPVKPLRQEMEMQIA
ncbi:MAG TPA: hypothetical protein PKK76_02790 [Leptospiraceae bacterium]|nr:hypothetical protein [Leptospiraceae bacterium]